MKNNPQFRPPAEARSLILQIDSGCPYNRCSFCGMYKHVGYERGGTARIEQLIADETRRHPRARRVFLADGDVMIRPADELRAILDRLGTALPRLARVNTYANGRSILAKSPDELRDLREHKLHTLYMGLESGDDSTLKRMAKAETADEMVRAGQLAQAADLKVSVMVLLGLGGRSRTREHAVATAEALNRMQPRLLSALRVVPVPGTPLYDDAAQDRFDVLTEHEIVGELRELVARLTLNGTVFRANHTSNVIPLEGRFPKDKPTLLAHLDALLASGELDATSPGHLPLWL